MAFLNHAAAVRPGVPADPGLWRATTATGPARWAGLVGLAAGLHVATFALGMWGSPDDGAFGQAEKNRAVVNVFLDAETPEYIPETADFRGVDRREGPQQPPEARQAPAGSPAPAQARLAETSRAVRPVRPAAGETDAEPARIELAAEGATAHQAETSERHSGERITGDPADAPLSAGPAAKAAEAPPRAVGQPAGKASGDGWDALSKSFDRAEGQQRGRAGLQLPGKPGYPQSCRAGTCKHGIPCEGLGRWRIISDRAGAVPTRVEMLKSAGCALLDASTRKFLLNSTIPEAGTFEVVIRFQISDQDR